MKILLKFDGDLGGKFAGMRGFLAIFGMEIGKIGRINRFGAGIPTVTQTYRFGSAMVGMKCRLGEVNAVLASLTESGVFGPLRRQ